MTGKVTSVSLPTNPGDGNSVPESYFNNVDTSLAALDAALAMDEPIAVDSTRVEVDTSTSETTIMTYNVPANAFGTGGVFRYEIRGYLYNDSGTSKTFTVKTYLGTTSLSDTIPVSDATDKYPVMIEGYVMADGSTSAQVAAQHILIQQANVAARSDSFAEDTTGALTLKVTVTADTSSAVVGFGLDYSQIFYVDPT